MEPAIFRDYNKKENEHSDRSAGDRAWHNRKIRDQLKEHISDAIEEGEIISSDGAKTFRIPIKAIKEYRFVFDDGSNPQVGQGTGQEGGEGESQPGSSGQKPAKVGDKINKEADQGDGHAHGAGGEGGPNEDKMEVEITMDEVAELMYEEMNMPVDSKPPTRKSMEQDVNRKLSGYKKKGPVAHLSKRKTAIERIKRKAAMNRKGR